tara:strand:- start:2778 stop:2969 length:192 start_codon:yes stop_codon:yes gene_type:complete
MDKIEFMKMFLMMGSMTDQTKEEELAYKERIVFATEGIIKPNDWEGLPFNERERRMELLIKEI